MVPKVSDYQYARYVDPGLSLMLVLLILKSVWPLLIESALILLQVIPLYDMHLTLYPVSSLY